MRYAWAATFAIAEGTCETAFNADQARMFEDDSEPARELLPPPPIKAGRRDTAVLTRMSDTATTGCIEGQEKEGGRRGGEDVPERLERKRRKHASEIGAQ